MGFFSNIGLRYKQKSASSIEKGRSVVAKDVVAQSVYKGVMAVFLTFKAEGEDLLGKTLFKAARLKDARPELIDAMTFFANRQRAEDGTPFEESFEWVLNHFGQVQEGIVRRREEEDDRRKAKEEKVEVTVEAEEKEVTKEQKKKFRHIKTVTRTEIVDPPDSKSKEEAPQRGNEV